MEGVIEWREKQISNVFAFDRDCSNAPRHRVGAAYTRFPSRTIGEFVSLDIANDQYIAWRIALCKVLVAGVHAGKDSPPTAKPTASPSMKVSTFKVSPASPQHPARARSTAGVPIAWSRLPSTRMARSEDSAKRNTTIRRATRGEPSSSRRRRGLRTSQV